MSHPNYVRAGCCDDGRTRFERVSIPRGQTLTVHIPLKGSSLAYWDETRNAWSTETGPVQIFVGGSSADERQSTSIRVD